MLNPGSFYYQGKKNWRGKDKELEGREAKCYKVWEEKRLSS